MKDNDTSSDRHEGQQRPNEAMHAAGSPQSGRDNPRHGELSPPPPKGSPQKPTARDPRVNPKAAEAQGADFGTQPAEIQPGPHTGVTAADFARHDKRAGAGAHDDELPDDAGLPET